MPLAERKDDSKSRFVVVMSSDHSKLIETSLNSAKAGQWLHNLHTMSESWLQSADKDSLQQFVRHQWHKSHVRSPQRAPPKDGCAARLKECDFLILLQRPDGLG